jgi:nucleoside 2-deoxyribosyltransferase
VVRDSGDDVTEMRPSMPSPKRLGNNLLVEPADLQQETIQAIYDVFREGGRWPTVDAIDRLVDEQWEADAYPLLKGLPPSLALLDRLHLRADQTVKLRVAAIAGCRNAEADLDLFVTAVRWLVLCERSRRPTDPHIAETLQVTSEEFAAARLATEGTQVNRVDSAKVYELVAVENLNWGGTAHIEGDPGRWQLNLTRTIRPYRRVEALADYLEIRRRTEEEAEKEAAAAGIPLILNEVAGEAVAHPVTDTEPYIFIAMPFEEPWSEDLYETIGTACESLGREGIVFRRERADEISRPGRVTEQIIDAIERADVVVADIGGLNANVVYELGYAHAGKATLILLSQNPEGSPFDLRDLRQIRYSTAEPAECLEELTRQLAAALGVTLQTPTDATRSQNRPEPFPSD